MDETDESDNGENDTQESEADPQEPTEDNPEEGVGASPELDSSGPETPVSEPAEAKMAHAVIDQMKKIL